MNLAKNNHIVDKNIKQCYNLKHEKGGNIMYYEIYEKLSDKDKNLANYLDYIKNHAVVSMLSRKELLSIINNYGYDIPLTAIDSYLKVKLLRNMNNKFNSDDNIKKIEEISTQITFLLNEKSKKVQPKELLKYKIIALLITNDEALSLLDTNVEENNIKKIYLIFNELSKLLDLDFDYSKININDLKKLNGLVNNYFEHATQNNYLVNNCRIFNIVNINDTIFDTVKKIRKKSKKAI